MLKSASARQPSERRAKPLTFRYQAHAGQDRIVKGTVTAISEVAAQNLLVEKGYAPISLEPIASPLSLEGALPSFYGIKPRQIINFSRQLATLLESGISLLPALQLLEGQVAGAQAFGRVVRTIAQDLGTGTSFAQAISRHPTAFSSIYARTIGVGERSGKLETVLRQMADYMEKQSAFAKKVSGALTYPAMVLGIAGVVSVILLTVALPPLTTLFESMNADLPLPTKILLFLSDIVNTYLMVILLAAGITIPLLIWYLKKPSGRRAMDRLKLSAPLLGPATQLAEMARICRTMSVLLGAGLSLQEIVELLPQTTTNSIVQDSLHRVKNGLFLGQGLTYPMSNDPVFPPLMLQMVRVGEESNSLEKNLTVLANFYELTADEKTAALIGMITPLTTIGIAFVAGFIALSVIMPMYSLTGNF